MNPLSSFTGWMLKKLFGTTPEIPRSHAPETVKVLFSFHEQHYPEFREVMAAQGKTLPFHVQQEFADDLKRKIPAKYQNKIPGQSLFE